MKNRLLTTVWLAVFLSMGCLFTLQAQNLTPTTTNGCPTGAVGGTFEQHNSIVCPPDLAEIPAVTGTTYSGVDPSDANVLIEYVLTDPQQQVPVNGETEAAIVGILTQGTTSFNPDDFVGSDEDICITGIVYDLRSIQRIIDAINPSSPNASCCSGISSFIGQDICRLLCNPDGVTPPQICDGTDITGFDQVAALLSGLGGGGGQGAFGIDSVILLVNSINDQIGPLAGAVDGICAGIGDEIPICIATTNTICYNFDGTTCVPACPTVVTTPVSGSEDVCGSATINLTALQANVVLDDPSEATFNWSSTNGPVNNPGAAPVGPNGCASTTTTFTLTVGCTSDPSVALNGGSYTVTAYPNYTVDIMMNGCDLIVELTVATAGCTSESSSGDCTIDLDYDFSGDVAPGTPANCISGDPITGSIPCPASCTAVDDCEGVPNGPAVSGTPCDDGDPCTADETYQTDCTCGGGTPVDADADGSLCGVDCDDNDGNLTVEGAACDDGDPGTENDVVTAGCACQGTVILVCEAEAGSIAATGCVSLCTPGPVDFAVTGANTAAPYIYALVILDGNEVIVKIGDNKDVSDGTDPMSFAGLAPGTYAVAGLSYNANDPDIAVAFPGGVADLVGSNAASLFPQLESNGGNLCAAVALSSPASAVTVLAPVNVNGTSSCSDPSGAPAATGTFYVEVTATGGTANISGTASNGTETYPVGAGTSLVGPFTFGNGDVTVSVNDDNSSSPGCTDCSSTIVVAERNCDANCNLTASFGDNPNNPDGENGGVTPFFYNEGLISLNGGLPPLSYDWDKAGYVRYNVNVEVNSGSGTIDVIYTDNAIFDLTITDAAGCTAVISSSATGDNLNIITSDITAATNVTATDGAIDITVAGGSGMYNFSWVGPKNFMEITEDISGLGYGWYSVNVVDANDPDNSTIGWFWAPVNTNTGGFTRGKDATVAGSWLNAYPNPLTTMATIDFGVQEAGQVNMVVYNVAGTKVADLFNNYVAAGELHSVPFNATDLAAGVYIVRFTTSNGETQHQKLIIAK